MGVGWVGSTIVRLYNCLGAGGSPRLSDGGLGVNSTRPFRARNNFGDNGLLDLWTYCSRSQMLEYSLVSLRIVNRWLPALHWLPEFKAP